MATVSKKHPSANWLRVSHQVYAQALNRCINFQDPDRAKQYFLTEELPRLIQSSNHKEQCLEHLKEIDNKLDEIQESLDGAVAGKLLQEKELMDEKKALQKVLSAAE